MKTMERYMLAVRRKKKGPFYEQRGERSSGVEKLPQALS